jgi:hypothetical protein
MEFISNQNKGLIWGLLQESDAFNGIEDDKFTNIQAMFEDTVSNVNRNNSKMTLLEKNKLTMNTMIKKINDEKTRPKKTIQMVYKAEDLQAKREQDFNLKLKEQQDELNKLINPTKPKEVSFSDANSQEDAPIGDEMDRLIAERLASRERELEIPQITLEAEQWLNNNRKVKLHIDEKKVSFSENKIVEQNEIDRPVTQLTVPREIITENSIFNKLKRKPDEQLSSKGMNLELEIKMLRENQESLMKICSQILSILQDK